MAAAKVLGRSCVRFGVIASRTACACAAAIAFTSEHPHFVSDDFRAISLLAFFVLPFSCLNAALNIYERPLLQILLTYLCQLPPGDDFVPLRALLALAVFVFVRVVRSDGKIGNCLPAARVARFWIAAETAYEDGFIH